MCLDAPETCGDTSSDIIRQDRQVDKLATARRSVTKIKMMMVRMIGEKKREVKIPYWQKWRPTH